QERIDHDVGDAVAHLVGMSFRYRFAGKNIVALGHSPDLLASAARMRGAAIPALINAFRRNSSRLFRAYAADVWQAAGAPSSSFGNLRPPESGRRAAGVGDRLGEIEQAAADLRVGDAVVGTHQLERLAPHHRIGLVAATGRLTPGGFRLRRFDRLRLDVVEEKGDGHIEHATEVVK